MDKKYDALCLENQLCFPLYACAKEVVRRYTPFLSGLDLTYTQYIAMMVLWENKEMNVKSLGEILYLDSGTLTPLLKKLEAKGYISRQRAAKDERALTVTLTEEGEHLKDKALCIPQKMAACVQLDRHDAAELHRILHKLMDSFE